MSNHKNSDKNLTYNDVVPTHRQGATGTVRVTLARDKLNELEIESVYM